MKQTTIHIEQIIKYPNFITEYINYSKANSIILYPDSQYYIDILSAIYKTNSQIFSIKLASKFKLLLGNSTINNLLNYLYQDQIYNLRNSNSCYLLNNNNIAWLKLENPLPSINYKQKILVILNNYNDLFMFQEQLFRLNSLQKTGSEIDKQLINNYIFTLLINNSSYNLFINQIRLNNLLDGFQIVRMQQIANLDRHQYLNKLEIFINNNINLINHQSHYLNYLPKITLLPISTINKTNNTSLIYKKSQQLLQQVKILNNKINLLERISIDIQDKEFIIKTINKISTRSILLIKEQINKLSNDQINSINFYKLNLLFNTCKDQQFYPNNIFSNYYQEKLNYYNISRTNKLISNLEDYNKVNIIFSEDISNTDYYLFISNIQKLFNVHPNECQPKKFSLNIFAPIACNITSINKSITINTSLINYHLLVFYYITILFKNTIINDTKKQKYRIDTKKRYSKINNMFINLMLKHKIINKTKAINFYNQSKSLENKISHNQLINILANDWFCFNKPLIKIINKLSITDNNYLDKLKDFALKLKQDKIQEQWLNNVDDRNIFNSIFNYKIDTIDSKNQIQINFINIYSLNNYQLLFSILNKFVYKEDCSNICDLSSISIKNINKTKVVISNNQETINYPDKIIAFYLSDSTNQLVKYIYFWQSICNDITIFNKQAKYNNPYLHNLLDTNKIYTPRIENDSITLSKYISYCLQNIYKDINTHKQKINLVIIPVDRDNLLNDLLSLISNIDHELDCANIINQYINVDLLNMVIRSSLTKLTINNKDYQYFINYNSIKYNKLDIILKLEHPEITIVFIKKNKDIDNNYAKQQIELNHYLLEQSSHVQNIVANIVSTNCELFTQNIDNCRLDYYPINFLNNYLVTISKQGLSITNNLHESKQVEYLRQSYHKYYQDKDSIQLLDLSKYNYIDGVIYNKDIKNRIYPLEPQQLFLPQEAMYIVYIFIFTNAIFTSKLGYHNKHLLNPLDDAYIDPLIIYNSFIQQNRYFDNNMYAKSNLVFSLPFKINFNYQPQKGEIHYNSNNSDSSNHISECNIYYFTTNLIFEINFIINSYNHGRINLNHLLNVINTNLIKEYCNTYNIYNISEYEKQLLVQMENSFYNYLKYRLPKNIINKIYIPKNSNLFTEIRKLSKYQLINKFINKTIKILNGDK